MKQMTSLTCVLVLVAASSAFAQPGSPMPPPPPPPPQGAPMAGAICVVIDPSRDTLAEADRNAARTLLLQAFEAQQLRTDATGAACSETYQVSNIKLGNTINVTITGPRGQRNGRATSLDDLPNVYSQMVTSLVTGTTMQTGDGNTDRNNVTKEQSAPRRVAADNLKYLQIGYGALTAAGKTATGPAFATGYRKELDRIALDIAISFIVGNDTSDNDGFHIAIPRLTFLWNQDPVKDSTFYYGAGLGYALSWVGSGYSNTLGYDDNFGGSGLQGNVTAGYAAYRSSTIRFFLQLDVNVPFYVAENGNDEKGWSPSAMFTLGFGWGKTTEVVRVINE